MKQSIQISCGKKFIQFNGLEVDQYAVHFMLCEYFYFVGFWEPHDMNISSILLEENKNSLPKNDEDADVDESDDCNILDPLSQRENDMIMR